MRFAFALTAACALLACPGPTTAPDAAVEDAGVLQDAGVDAGRPQVDAGPPDAGFTQVPIGQWCDLLARAQCFRDGRCGRVAAATSADCLVRMRDACDQLVFDRGVAEGRLAFDEPAAVACLNGYAEGSCTEAPAACSRAVRGVVPADGGCVASLECDATQSFCYLYDNVCPHRCRGWVPLGGVCDSFSTRCDPDGGVCIRDGGVSTCVAARAPGAACTDFSSCGEGLACIQSTCVARTTVAGGVCGEASGYPYCPREFFCRQLRDTAGLLLPGTCQLRSGLGGACQGNGMCLPSLRCTSLIATGTCTAKVARGGACSSYDDCEDGHFCTQQQRCAPFPVAGGDCSTESGSFYRCAPGHFCRYAPVGEVDTCVARQAESGECSYDEMCLSKECEFGTLADGGFGGQCGQSCAQKADGGF